MTSEVRVLILDDDPHGRALAAAELRREFADLEVLEAGDAVALRRMLDDQPPQAVVTESHLAWGDHRSVLRLVKLRRPSCPVVLFTHAAELDAVVAAMKSGLDDCVLKPLEGAGRLGGAVRDAIERSVERRLARGVESAYRGFFDGAPVALYRTTPDLSLIHI